MNEIDRVIKDRDKFRKAYAAEVKASAESKRRSSTLIEWTESQLQTAMLSHAGQLRNTLAFKADCDVLIIALRDIISIAKDANATDALGDIVRRAEEGLAK